MKRMFILLAFLMIVSYGHTQRMHSMQELDIERHDKKELKERAENARIGAHVYDARLNKQNSKLTRNSVSATYTAGDISTDHLGNFNSPTISDYSSCPGELTVSIPEGAIITAVDVDYDMTTSEWMSELRSRIICTTTGGTDEPQYYAGTGGFSGTQNFSRSGLDIANNVSGVQDVTFEMHAFRTYGGSGCDNTIAVVDNGTWTITVYYQAPPDNEAALTQIIAPEDEVTVGTESDFIVELANYGLNTLTEIDIDYVIGDITGTYNWTGSLERFETEEVNLYASYLFDVLGAVDVSATLNWDLDEMDSNNHVETTVQVLAEFAMLAPIGEGMVTPLPGDYIYTPGTIVDLIACPAPGYTFGNWNMGDVQDANTARTSIEIAEGHEVQATFNSYNADMLYLQNVSGESSSTSFISESDGYEVADNFSNSGIEEITTVVVYGLTLIHNGTSWVEWTPGETEPFVVRFYDEDAATEPDWANPVAAQMIDAKVYDAGPVWNGQYTAYKFELNLTSPVDLTSGWVSVQINATQDEAPGWFLWLTAEEGMGDGQGWQQNITGTNTLGDDDFTLELWGTEGDIAIAPDCINLNFPAHDAQNVKAKNATLSWQHSANAEGYLLYLGADELPETAVDLGNVVSYEIELDYETNYYWSVVPYNEGGQAEGCAAFSFTTETDLALYPSFVEDFNTTPFPPVNWTRFSGTLSENTVLAPVTGTWTHGNFGNVSGTANSAYLNIYGARNHWLVTPSINLGDGETDYQLVFDMALTPWSGTDQINLGPNDYVAVVISNDNGMTWSDTHVLIDWDASDTMSPTGIAYKLPLEGYSGLVKLGFYVFRASGTVPDLRIYFDNIGVVETPTTPIFSIDTQEIDFDLIAIGETSPAQTVTITNEGIGSVDVELPVLDNTDNFILGFVAEDFPAVLAEGESVSFTVTFEPQVAGNIPGEITVAYNDGEAKSATVNLQGEAFDPTLPVFSIDLQEWDFGNIQVGAQSASKVFTISNPGNGTLEVAAPAIDNEVDFDLTFAAEDFPAELAADETVSFSVVFDALSEGLKEADVTISYNDGQDGTATVALVGTGFIRPEGSTCNNPLVIELPLEDYMDNTEMYGDDYSSDWIDPTSSYLNGNDFVAQFTLDKPGMLTGSVAGSWTGLIILKDCPDPETPAARLAFAGTSTGGTANVMLEPGTYFAIVSTFPSPQFTDFTLNLSFETYYEVSLMVTDGTDPIGNALIDITPGGTQLTNVSGEAEFILADGEYDFLVSADGYATATGSFMVDGANVVIPEIVLLSTNDITFNVADAATNPLNGVNLHIQGTADAGGWDIDQTFMVNGSEVLGLPNGSYTWTAQKDGYYAETDAFVVNGDDVMDITLNIFPLVTIAIEDAEGNPLADVNVTIEDMEPMVTNMDGEVSLRLADAGEYNFVAEKDDYYMVTDMFTLADADLTVTVEMTIFPMVEFTVISVVEGVDVPLADVSIKIEDLDALITSATGEVATRLPAGNYNFSAYLIGYDEVTGEFDMVNGELTLVDIALEESEPRFELTQEWPDGADFGLMVTGLTSEVDFEFTNTGFTDLTLSVENNISINPADGMFTIKAGEGIADEWVLATGETGTITVQFTPTSGGAHTADLVFSFGEEVLIALTGEAYEPLTLPFTEDFETNGLDQWLVVNGEQVNQWHVGTAHDDTENLSAMISNDEGATNAYTIDDAASVVHFYMDFDIPDASTTLAFQWKGNGQAAFDFLRVSVVETSVMPQPGSALSGAHVLGSFINQPNWRTEEVTLPGAFEGKTARLVFTWRNNASGGTQPPAAIDNIMITQTRNVVMVASVDDINVDYQTAPEEVPLPETNTVTLDGEYFGETEVDLDVVWDTATPEYNGNVAGTYIFTGQVVLIPGISNTDDLIVTAQVTVDKGLPVVTWPSASGITYGETLAASTLTNGEAVYQAEEVTGEFAFGNSDFLPVAGIYTADVTFTPDDTNNYLIVNGTVEVDVNQFPITITANDILKRQGLTYEFEGTEFAVEPLELIGDDEVTSATLTSDGAPNDAVAGFYDIVISDAVGNGIDNYAITYVNGEMEVTDKELLSLPDMVVADKVYDGTNAATVTQWGDLAGIVADGPDVQLDFSNAVVEFSTSNAGTGITVTARGLQLSGDDADIYRIGNQITTADIETKDLTITAEDKTKVYGQLDDELTVVFDGFVDGQSVSDLGGVLSVVREPGEDTGEYVITASGLTSPNYAIEFVAGVFSITTRAITITADAQTKIYGDDEPELTFQLSDDELQFDDEFTGELTREAGEDAGEYEILQGTIALNDNYTLFYESAVFTISPKDITITADAINRIYGETDPALTYQVTTGELQFNDAFTGELTREAGEDVGVYEIQQGTVALTDNYNLSYVAADFTITQRALEITADAKTKVYGDDDPEFTYTITDGDLVFDDAISGILDREAGEDVGSYAINIGTLSAGANYDVTLVSADLAITPLAITVTADDQSKVYGEADPVFTYEVTAGDLAFDDVFTGELTREAGEDAGAYAIEQGTLTAGSNYELTFEDAQMVITAKEVSIGGSFEVADKDYDGTTEAVITDNQLVIIGTVGDDDIALADLVAEFVSSEPAADITVELTGAVIAGAQAANYVLSMEGAPTATADIFAPVFALTIDIDPVDAGSVTGEGDYEENESVTVTAVANEGFDFKSWMIGEQEVSTDASYTFDMPAEDLTLVAKFDIIDAVDDFEVVNLNLFPNPARDNFSITSGSQIRTVMIVDMAGQVVYTNDVDATEISIDNAFETGVYIVRIYTDNGVFVRKLQIQK